jgi:hypothetical protein
LQRSPLMMPLSQGSHHGSRDLFDEMLPLFADSIPDGFGLRLMNRGLGPGALLFCGSPRPC